MVIKVDAVVDNFDDDDDMVDMTVVCQVSIDGYHKMRMRSNTFGLSLTLVSPPRPTRFNNN